MNVHANIKGFLSHYWGFSRFCSIKPPSPKVIYGDDPIRLYRGVLFILLFFSLIGLIAIIDWLQ